MNIHEYQAKSLLADYGVAVPRGHVAFTPEEAENAARDLGGPIWVVKSQIHAGGRGAGRFRTTPTGPAAFGSASRSTTSRKTPARCWARAGHQADGRPGQGGQAALYRGRLRHRAGALSGHADRPGDQPHHHHGLHRRRYGDRGGGRGHPGEDLEAGHRSGGRIHALPRPQAGLRSRPGGQAGLLGGEVHDRHVQAASMRWMPRSSRSIRWW